MNEHNGKTNVNFINGIIKTCCLKDLDIDTGYFFLYDNVLYFKTEREDEDIETHEHSYLCYAITENFSKEWINENECVYPMDVDIKCNYIYEKGNTWDDLKTAINSKCGLSTSDWGDNYL